MCIFLYYTLLFPGFVFVPFNLPFILSPSVYMCIFFYPFNYMYFLKVISDCFWNVVEYKLSHCDLSHTLVSTITYRLIAPLSVSLAQTPEYQSWSSGCFCMSHRFLRLNLVFYPYCWPSSKTKLKSQS